jgi:putative ABC transport system permease protein
MAQHPGQAASRVLSSVLYRVTSTDPATFATVALVLLGTTAAAIYLPARRATKVDPIVTLHYE